MASVSNLSVSYSRNNPTPKIPGLDGLRAISILMVIAYHLGDHCVGLQVVCRNLFPEGAHGVTVFFVISGFLITHLLCVEQEKTGAISLGDFYNRRAFRILPPALIFLALTAPLAVDCCSVLHCLFFVRNFFPSTGTSVVNGHFWSLSVEEQFYVFWPACFVLLRTNRRRLLAIAPVLVAAPIWQHIASRIPGMLVTGGSHSWFNGNLHHDIIFGSLLLLSGHLPILVGCALALLRHEKALEWTVWHDGRVAAVVLLMLCVAFWRGPNVAPFLVAYLINFVVSRGPSFLDWAPLAWVGRLSYSLYLWQQIFCFQSPLPIVGLFPLNIIATFAFAAASYYGIEKPALRFRLRFSQARQVAVTA